MSDRLEEAVEAALAAFLGADRWAKEPNSDAVEWRADMRKALKAAAPILTGTPTKGVKCPEAFKEAAIDKAGLYIGGMYAKVAVQEVADDLYRAGVEREADDEVTVKLDDLQRLAFGSPAGEGDDYFDSRTRIRAAIARKESGP